jgi:LCP family protein required for cell wall assembly
VVLRAVSWLLAVVGGVGLLGSAGLLGVYLHYTSAIQHVNVAGLRTSTTAAVATPEENILLVGSDSRDGATAADLARARTADDGGGTNTDTILLVHLPAGNGAPTMISFPRDSYLTVPGWPGRHRINSIYAHFGGRGTDGKGQGPSALVQTVERLTGLSVDHYVEVNFFGFMDLTDALGGVEVCLKAPAKDAFSGIDLPAGLNHLDGPTALEFVRQRHGLANEDLDRIKRQQYFGQRVATTLRSSNLLTNPVKLNSVLSAALKHLYLDQGLGADGLRSLALRIRNIDLTKLNQQTVPIAGPYTSPYGEDVLLVDYPALTALVAPLKPGYTPPPATATASATATATATPSQPATTAPALGGSVTPSASPPATLGGIPCTY